MVLKEQKWYKGRDSSEEHSRIIGPTFSESETRAVLNLLDISGDPCKSMFNDVLALTFNKRIQNIPKHYYNYVACQKPINVSYTSLANRITAMGTVAKLKFNNLESYTMVRCSSSLRSSSCYSSQCMLPIACRKKDRWWTAGGKYRLSNQRTNARRRLNGNILHSVNFTKQK